MSKTQRRIFGRAFKLVAVERMEAGESASALSEELGVKRTLLYRWRDAVRAGGAEAVRDGPGRPTLSQSLAMKAARGPASKARGLAEARRQIAELERKVGQQQADLDFFKQALRRVEGAAQPSAGSTASSSRSRR
jgi:transposase-like protein